MCQRLSSSPTALKVMRFLWPWPFCRKWSLFWDSRRPRSSSSETPSNSVKMYSLFYTSKSKQRSLSLFRKLKHILRKRLLKNLWCFPTKSFSYLRSHLWDFQCDNDGEFGGKEVTINEELRCRETEQLWRSRKLESTRTSGLDHMDPILRPAGPRNHPRQEVQW